MRLRLSFQNEQIFRQQLLPVMNNADFYYILRADLFWLEDDLELHFEIIGGKWRIFPSEGCRMYVQSDEEEFLLEEPSALADGQCIRIRTMNAEEMMLRVAECGQILFPCKKYLLPESGQIFVGGQEDCALRLVPENFCGESRLVLETEENGVFLENRGAVPVYLNGAVLCGRIKPAFGDRIDFSGISLFWLGSVLAVRAEDPAVCIESSLPELPEETPETADEPEQDLAARNKETLYHRAPRNMEPVHTGEIGIEGPPDKYRQNKTGILQIMGSSVLMVLPMLVGCLLMIAASRSSGYASSWFMYIGLVMAICSAIVGIIWGLLNYRQQKKEKKTEEAHRFEAYSRYLIEKTDVIRHYYHENKEIMLRMHPAASQCIGYDRNGTELWNRNSEQGDFLQIRIGTGDIPFQIRIMVPEDGFYLYDDDLRKKPELIRKNYETLYDVPIMVDLKKENLLGLIGGEEKYGAYALMRTIVLQLAATHSYTELKMAFLYDERTEGGKWSFAKWLPHTWSEDRKNRYTGGTPDEISEVCYRLNRIFNDRLEKASRQQEGILPHYVIFLSDPGLIENELISGALYQHAAAAGFSTVLLADIRETLPNACTDFINNDETFRGILHAGERCAVSFDEVSEAELEKFARRISGIRVRETDITGEIPKTVSFMEMYGKTRVEDLEVRERWLKNRTANSIRGLLGLKGGGEPVFLDLHEKYHGPHGLVAGTTGSGKSETLQTYMLSLAVEFSPDDVNFFVIDFKGGGMANLFGGLPHMTGSISNLSGAQIYRALVSIKSENRRRQRLFNQAGVNNINKYSQAYKEGRVPTPIPHLFIIVDEFAELKREEPDFMRELISVVQVGRSLGVHLILATQKPSGTVDDNIWSNSRFRICLRVQTKEDSMDMLGKPDAAFLTDTGRGYLQVGHDELFEQFQSGYSGAAYDPENSETDREATCFLTGTGQVDLRCGAKKRSRYKKEITQLDVLVRHLTQVAAEEGYRETYPMWMPPLRNPLYLEELEEYRQSAADDKGWKVSEEDMRSHWELSAVIGQTDDPQNQVQKPLTLSLSEGGHHSVVGSVVCGKSTLLQTIIFSLVNKYSPEYLNIYAIDYSSRMLSAFEGLAHVGGVMYEGEEKKTERFFRMLEEMLKERKQKYRGGNYAQYVRANGADEPAILVVIDNFALFQERTEEKHLPFLLTLSREGLSNGIYLLVSAGGYGITEIPNRLAENIGTALPLALPDRYAYGDILHTMKVPLVPETVYRGRGLCCIDGVYLEFQTALALEASDDYQRIEKIRSRCETLNSIWNGPAAPRVPEIPEKPAWDEFRNLPDVQNALALDRFLPIGYYSESARICSIDLYQTYCYLVAGARRSGKKNLMRLMILAALSKPNGGVFLIDGENRLKDLHHSENLHIICTDDELYRFCMDDLTPLFAGRNKKKHVLLDQGFGQEEYYQEMADEKPVFIFIEDLLWFAQAVYRDTHDMKGFMETLFRRGENHKIYFIGALSLDSRTQAAGFEAFNLFARYGTGIHLGGNTTQNPFMKFDNMSYTEQLKTEPPGTGLIPDTVAGRAPMRIVIPTAAKIRRVQNDRD